MFDMFQNAGAQAALDLLKLGAAYKLQGRRDWRGLNVSIENRKGSRRYWKDPNSGDKGSNFMHHSYGYIRLTKGSDGDHLDVYLGPNIKAENVYIINQMKKPEGSTHGDGKRWTVYDEQKCMLGFNSAKEAKAAYIKQYNDPRFFGSLKVMPFPMFKMKALRSLVGGRHKIAEGAESITPVHRPEQPLEASSLIGVTRDLTTRHTGAVPSETIDRAFHFHVPAVDNEPAITNSQSAPSGLTI